jgi:outer membrane protein assembly factor BamB
VKIRDIILTPYVIDKLIRKHSVSEDEVYQVMNSCNLKFPDLGGCYLRLISILLSLGFAVQTHADWTSFRGNPQLTGVSTDSLPENLELLWTFAAEDSIESTAAIAAGVVYVGSLDGRLYALDLETGQLKWKYQASDEVKSSPSAYQNAVYFGDEAGDFHALDAKTGQRNWMFHADAGIISSANFVGDRVLFGAYDQFLYCLSTKDGGLIWKFETEGYVHCTPAIVNGSAIISGCDSYLRIINVSDGVEKMQIDLGDYVGASAAILNNRAYVGTFGNRVLSIDLAQAKIVWRYEHQKRQFPFYSSAAATKDLVIVGGRDTMIHALSPQTGKPLWTFPARAKVDSSPVIVGQRVFFGTASGVIYALNVNSGEAVWQFETGASIVASPSVAAGKLVIGSEDGVLYCFGERKKNGD